jgi:hypothetical protein
MIAFVLGLCALAAQAPQLVAFARLGAPEAESYGSDPHAHLVPGGLSRNMEK